MNDDKGVCRTKPSGREPLAHEDFGHSLRR